MERGFRPRQVRARIERLVVAGPAFPFHHGEGPRVVRARRFPPALGLIRHAEIDEKQRCQTAIRTFDPGRLRQQAKQCLASLLQVAGAHPGVPDAVMCPEEVRVSFREMLRVDALGFLVEPQPLCVVAQIDPDFDADHSRGRRRFCKTVIHVHLQGRQRNRAAHRFLAARHLRSAQPARQLHLDAEHARFEREKLSPGPLRDFKHDGATLARFFFVSDPDGYKIEVIQKGGRFG